MGKKLIAVIIVIGLIINCSGIGFAGSYPYDYYQRPYQPPPQTYQPPKPVYQPVSVQPYRPGPQPPVMPHQQFRFNFKKPKFKTPKFKAPKLEDYYKTKEGRKQLQQLQLQQMQLWSLQNQPITYGSVNKEAGITALFLGTVSLILILSLLSN